MRPKHQKDRKCGKQGWVGGNPRFGKRNGSQKGQRAASNASWKKEV